MNIKDLKPCPACESTDLQMSNSVGGDTYVKCMSCEYFVLFSIWQEGTTDRKSPSREAPLIKRIRQFEQASKLLKEENEWLKGVIARRKERDVAMVKHWTSCFTCQNGGDCKELEELEHKYAEKE